MKKGNKMLPLVLLLILCFLIAGCSSASQASLLADESGLADQMTWSVYDVGSGGYAEMSAIANVLTEKYDTKVRMLPSASGVGRMVPLRREIASVGKVGDEIQLAFEGTEEFTSKKWGPQDVRAYWAPISQFGFAVRENSDIQTLKDLRGKKIPIIAGNTSVNLKNEAMLAFAGLTWDDVEPVKITSYSGQGEALIQGQIDVAGINPTASTMFEAHSKGGIRWLEMDKGDDEGWARVEEVAAWLFPIHSKQGAGMEKGFNVMGHGYLIGGYADQSEEAVYQFIKSLNDSFHLYSDALPNLALYGKDEVLTEPKGIPFHDGVIRFFKEEGLWSKEKQQKNDQLIERYEELREVWDKTVAYAEKEDLTDEEFEALWLQNRETVNKK
ncbi:MULTISPECIES: TAXI family TRAP transporter solute-binding subunit [Cytobacillus]|uniref:TAXI family TRAP transporter solute-binding subunit n=1 Tax=Cytobacillus stercorigallinarum TaxID=2762240 RepID=A0ABR8QLU1_9BACI|nr:TAXI family TRAP transporter solute-binding subunit [Cytobacillus stercorigallinarum]MBD7936485.1 TAXI family TRAP transporter solute-binding subunit [Cytobacillus stercorigallinarum]